MRNRPYRYGLGDEAGETGFKFERGSTTFFVYSLVLTDNLQPLREYVRVYSQLDFAPLGPGDGPQISEYSPLGSRIRRFFGDVAPQNLIVNKVC